MNAMRLSPSEVGEVCFVRMKTKWEAGSMNRKVKVRVTLPAK